MDSKGNGLGPSVYDTHSVWPGQTTVHESLGIDHGWYEKGVSGELIQDQIESLGRAGFSGNDVRLNDPCEFAGGVGS